MGTQHDSTKWIGKKFGRLLVTEFLYTKKVQQKDRLRNKYYYKCLCDCGKETEVATCCIGTHKVRTRSCGCLQKEGWIIGHDKQRGKARPQSQKPNGYSILHSAFLSCRNGAIKRKLLFDLSESEFETITSKNCHYCGEAPIIKKKPKEHVFRKLNGIDRVDSNQGYVLNNCVPCCKICNYMKQELSVTNWTSHMNKVINFMNTRGVM